MNLPPVPKLSPEQTEKLRRGATEAGESLARYLTQVAAVAMPALTKMADELTQHARQAMKHHSMPR